MTIRNLETAQFDRFHDLFVAVGTIQDFPVIKAPRESFETPDQYWKKALGAFELLVQNPSSMSDKTLAFLPDASRVMLLRKLAEMAFYLDDINRMRGNDVPETYRQRVAKLKTAVNAHRPAEPGLTLEFA